MSNYSCEFAHVDKTLGNVCVTVARVCEYDSVDAGKDKRRLCWNYDNPAAVSTCWIRKLLGRGENDGAEVV